MLQVDRAFSAGNVPELDAQVTGRGGKDVLGGRVEEDLSDFSMQRNIALAGLDLGAPLLRCPRSGTRTLNGQSACSQAQRPQARQRQCVE